MTEKSRTKKVEDRPPIRCGWNSSALLTRGILSDKQIEKYAKRGWYSPEFKKARLERMREKQQKRDGNFLVQPDGKMIFSPK